jgi:hypothetical protein
MMICGKKKFTAKTRWAQRKTKDVSTAEGAETAEEGREACGDKGSGAL